MTQKILAAHAGLDKVEAGQLISAKLDILLGNDITTPVAINEFNKAGFENVFDKRPDENSFICDSVRVANGTCCFMDWDEANYKLQKFLDKYEFEHPGVKFERSNGGAGIKFGDWK